jgi:hypothetical protein
MGIQNGRFNRGVTHIEDPHCIIDVLRQTSGSSAPQGLLRNGKPGGPAFEIGGKLGAKTEKALHPFGIAELFGIWCPEEDSNLHTLSSTST